LTFQSVTPGLRLAIANFSDDFNISIIMNFGRKRSSDDVNPALKEIVDSLNTEQQTGDQRSTSSLYQQFHLAERQQGQQQSLHYQQPEEQQQNRFVNHDTDRSDVFDKILNLTTQYASTSSASFDNSFLNEAPQNFLGVNQSILTRFPPSESTGENLIIDEDDFISSCSSATQEQTVEQDERADFLASPPLPIVARSDSGKKLEENINQQQEKMRLEAKIQFVKDADFSTDVLLYGKYNVVSKRRKKNGDFKSDESFSQTCIVCDKHYTCSAYYRQHCREFHHSCWKKGQKYLGCSLCGAVFSSAEEYRKHEENTKYNLIYCIHKMIALRSTQKDTTKLYKNVSALDLHVMENYKDCQ
jgi:uncharacterized C2H2 Zn-finger protein